ncbi:MAG: sodium:solute symporter family protein [Spirochaetales bacterium]|nr:sodium:solute symporter family protein [Spirochaetales bacterium]MCF7937267.1 sodium:solute symporter family protein [Spirochaetales bacterium]
MNIRFLLVLLYLFATLTIPLVLHCRNRKENAGFFPHRPTGGAEFFLAGRSLKPILLFFTMTASNFSAFTIFGLSGAGYRMGYAFYPVMGFGTGLMALSLYLVGRKLVPLSRRRGYITPADFFRDRYRSKPLAGTASAVMILFTLPYLALQAIAAGHSLYALAGIPYAAGAGLITAFVTAYVALGGLRSIAWTDVLQGLMLLFFAALAFGIVADRSGGFTAVNQRLFAEAPELFSRPGVGGSLGRGVWTGYLVLWFFSVPFTPHLFQRLYAVESRKALSKTVILYPLLTTLLFFLTVGIGVIGRLSFPDLAGSESDRIFPLLLGRYTGPVLGTLILTGSIAALMSTMDSQLLTLTSMISRDFGRPGKPRKPVSRQKAKHESRNLSILLLLGLFGFLIALRPPESLLEFVSATTFNGISVLAPIVYGGIYLPRPNPSAGFFALITGEVLVVLYYFHLLPDFGTLPVIPILLITTLVYTGITAAGRIQTKIKINGGFFIRRKVPLLFLLLTVVSGNDFWAWGKRPILIMGLPLWLWYFAGLGLFLSFFYAWFIRRDGNARIYDADSPKSD